MGGRLDATNAVDTDCALIVSIDLDHREWLGETREAIGREKAGIVRRGKPVVIGDRAVPASVLEHAAAVGAVPYLIGRDFDFRRDGVALAQGARYGCSGAVCRLPPFGGDEQFANAASCAAVVDCLRGALPVTRRGARGRNRERLSCAAASSGTSSTASSGSSTSGHNPAAAERLEASLRRLPAAARTWIVFAAMRDKDLAGVVQPFVGGATAGSSRKRARTAARRAPSFGTCSRVSAPRACTSRDDVAAACAAARAAAAPAIASSSTDPSIPWAPRLEALRLYCAPSPLVDRPATWTRV